MDPSITKLKNKIAPPPPSYSCAPYVKILKQCIGVEGVLTSGGAVVLRAGQRLGQDVPHGRPHVTQGLQEGQEGFKVADDVVAKLPFKSHCK